MMQSLNKSFNRYTRDAVYHKNLSETPEMKLSGHFSSGKGTRENSEQMNYKMHRHCFDKTDNEGNETFITSTDYHQQMASMDDRISKLENLVWSLYRELNGKIEQNNVVCQKQIEEVSFLFNCSKIK
jgi:lysine/ornithine N-monooxygenase